MYGLLSLSWEEYMLQEELININKNMILFPKLKIGGKM